MTEPDDKSSSSEGGTPELLAETAAKRPRRSRTPRSIQDMYVVLHSVCMEFRSRSADNPMSARELSALLDAGLRQWKRMYL